MAAAATRTVHADRILTRPFVLTMLAELALCMSIGMLLAVVPVFADDELGVGSFGVALAVAAASPMVLVCQPLAGRIGDRRGRRKLVIVGGVVAAIAVAGYVVVDSLAILVLLRLLTGAGEALLLVGTATMVTDLAPEHRRGEALSLFSLGLWGGLALGPLLGELVLGDDRFDAVWLVAAACCLAAGVIGIALPETGPAKDPAAPRANGRLIHPAAIGPGLVLAFTVLGFAGLGTFGALYARELGLDGAGSVFLVFSVVVVGTRVVARQVPDRLGPKRTSRAALALIAAGLFTIGLWNVPAGLFAGTVVVGFGHALAFPSLMTLAVNAGPPSERSAVVGTFSAFTELGFLAGALTLGAIASAVGYSGVFVVCAFGPLLGVLVLARMVSRSPLPAPGAA
jgi:MFS family permease